MSQGRSREQSLRLWLVAASLLLGAAVVHLEPVTALVGPTLILVLLLVAVDVYIAPANAELRRKILNWSVLSYFSHLLFSLLITSFSAGGLTDILRAPDSIVYHARALDILRHWDLAFPLPVLPAGKEGYYYMLAGIYRFFGIQVSAGLAVNALLTAALVPIVADTTNRLFGEKAAAKVIPLPVLLPGLFLWSSQLGKEAAVLFFIALAANCSVRLVERISLPAIVGFALAISLLFSFRGWVGLMVACGLIAGVAFGRQDLTAGLGTGLGVAAALAALVVVSGLGYSGYTAAVESDLKQADRIRRDLAIVGRSGYDAQVDVSTPLRAVQYLPVGLAKFTLSPFPWELRGARQLPALAEAVVVWALLPSLWRGFRTGRAQAGRRVRVLLLPALTTAVLLTLSVGNFGTQLRERQQVIILLLPIIALGLSERQKREAESSVPGEPATAV